MSALAAEVAFDEPPPLDLRPAGEGVFLLACEGCGRVFALKARAVRALLRGERSARCRWCVYQVVLEVRDEHREFWTSRFTTGEIVAMAEASWGPRSGWSVRHGAAAEGWRAGFAFAPIGQAA